LANHAPETVKFEHDLRLLWIKRVEVKDVSVETAITAFAKAVTETFPQQSKLRFVMQVKTTNLLSLSFSSPVPFTEALCHISDLAPVEFVVDRDTICVRPKAEAKSQ
jgi:hypothetical protein